jgi:hypothetical protein
MHAWLAYWTVCIPGITYSSSTTSLTEEQCSQVEKIIKPSLVKKLGLPDTFPNLMLYGDKYFGGVGILQLFAEQGSMNQTLSIMRHIQAKSTLGDQILIALRHYQNQAGISKCVLSDTIPLPHMSIPWFDTFRQYLDNINGRLELTQSWQLKPQRAHDTFLMENFLNLKTFTPKEMKILNACRMYYQVTRLSDITTPDGSRLMAKISNGMLSREQFNVVYKPQNEWPEQERPNKTSWKLWQKALRLTVRNVSGRLYKPLGSWNRDIDPDWIYYLSTTDNYLYQSQDNVWTRYAPIRLGITQTYNKTRHISEPPNLPYPANPKVGNKHYTCHHSCSKRLPQLRHNSPTWTNLEEFLDAHMHTWERHLLSDIEETQGGMTLADALRLGLDIWLVTDGGDTDGNGYYGWVIATNTHILVRGKDLSPGNQEQNESLRSESTAYLSSGLRFLVHYKNYHQLTLELSNKFHFCDNKSLVGRSKDTYASAPPSSFSFLKPDYDVQMEIIKTIKELDIDLETQWVKGHQDDHRDHTQLSYESRVVPAPDENFYQISTN